VPKPQDAIVSVTKVSTINLAPRHREIHPLRNNTNLVHPEPTAFVSAIAGIEPFPHGTPPAAAVAQSHTFFPSIPSSQAIGRK
jgi:hypothetical protein